MKRPWLLAVGLACCLTLQIQASDWPQFRYDVGRTAASPQQLPTDLQLQWTLQLPAPRPAFPNELRLGYDASYEPVVMGTTMFVPSMVTDSITALDTETGAQRWRFYAGGPVRFAPAAWQGKVYFVSDDGYLYCVAADTGQLHWKFRGLPADRRDRKVVGHGRVISLYPARGGPALADGIVYFAAGLWPTEGVFVHAVDANTGKAIWSNTECDHISQSNWDHGIGHYAGLTPQGYLAIVGEHLIVPCGAQLPAFLDRTTGKLQKYTMGWGGRLGLPKGCWFVAGAGKYLSHGGDLFDITRPSDEHLANLKPGQRDYKRMLYPGGWTRLEIERANQRELDRFSQPVMTPTVMYESDQKIIARDLSDYKIIKRTPENIPPYRSKDEVPDSFGATFHNLWELPSKLGVFIKAGDWLLVGGPGIAEAIDVSTPKPHVVWHTKLQGTPQRMLAAGDKLFIVTRAGSILAFGKPQSKEVIVHQPTRCEPASTADRWTEMATAILKSTGENSGFALVLGIDSGRLVEELVRQSKLHVVAVDDDIDAVTALRKRLDDMGLYGTRATVLAGDPATYPFSPCMANLVVTETPDELAQADAQDLVQTVFHTLRPYGGKACAWGVLADRPQLEQLAQRESCHGAQITASGQFVILARTGALPGSANWSHAEANAACTAASTDQSVRAPLSILWFDAAQRWHKYPGQDQVRVAGGRIVVMEEGDLSALDVYTGRTLWKVTMAVGKNPVTDPIARAATRYARHRQWGPQPSLSPNDQLVALEDAIYVTEGRSCLVLDPASGKTVNRFNLPSDLKQPWSNLRVVDQTIIGSSGPNIVAVQRHSGKVLWRYKVDRSGLSLAVGGGKVFCATLADPRRGEKANTGSIVALDLVTGKRLWQRPGGARLRYNPALDLIVTAGGFFRATDGQPIPLNAKQPAAGFVIKGGGLPKTGIPGYVAGNRLLTGDDENLIVYEMPSGKQLGSPLHWVRRGCTGTRAGMNLLATRYRGNAAWIDLETRKISPLLGVRPGCSINNNLYPANGVLNIPALNGGCTCNYTPASVVCIPTAVLDGDGPR